MINFVTQQYTDTAKH